MSPMRTMKKGQKSRKKRPRVAESFATDGEDMVHSMMAIEASSGGRGWRKKKKRLEKVAKKGLSEFAESRLRAGSVDSEASDEDPASTKYQLEDVVFKWGGGDDDGRPSEELKLVRKSLGVKVKGPCPAPVTSVGDPHLPRGFSQFFAAHPALTRPTPVQQQCWPALLNGSDALIVAPTGSGKTLTYLLPLVEMVNALQHRIRHLHRHHGVSAKQRLTGLILVPTRELALQIKQVSHSLRKLFGVRCMCVVGGMNKIERLEQQQSLQETTVHFLVATPGRLIDMLDEGSVSLTHVKFFVLDEADRMLEMGFLEQLHRISHSIPPTRQTCCLSATFPKDLRDAATSWIRHRPVTIRIGTSETGQLTGGDGSASARPAGKTSLALSETITHRLQVTTAPEHRECFTELLHDIYGEEGRTAKSTLVFCNRKGMVDDLLGHIAAQGIRCCGLHGDMGMVDRRGAIEGFASGKYSVLVATDIAARGLDIRGVKHVINYDAPRNMEVFTHRVGRTGRAGAKGYSHTLILDSQAHFAADLVRVFDTNAIPVEEAVRELAEKAGKAAHRRAATKAQPEDGQACAPAVMEEQFRSALTAFYTQHNPEKLAEVEFLVTKYFGSIELDALMGALRKKYAGSRPSFPRVQFEHADDLVFARGGAMMRSILLENDSQEAVDYTWSPPESTPVFTVNPAHGTVPPDSSVAFSVSVLGNSPTLQPGDPQTLTVTLRASESTRGSSSSLPRSAERSIRCVVVPASEDTTAAGCVGDNCCTDYHGDVSIDA